MTGPVVKWEVNLTTVMALLVAALTIGTVIFGGGARFASLEAQISGMAGDVQKLNQTITATETRAIAEIASVRSDAALRESRLRVVENRQAAETERMGAMYEAVRRIERILEGLPSRTQAP